MANPVLAPDRGGGMRSPRALAHIDWLAWLPKWSKVSAIRALRATIVIPGLFAFTDKVVGNLQMATFAAFGGFATLVLANFAGTRRDKAISHLALAVAGTVLITIGTAVNSSTVAAALVTLPVAFLIYFAGVLGPNAASGATAALLPYVLPAASPGTMHLVPARLAGWWMASVLGTLAVLALPTPSAGAGLGASAASAARAIGEALRAALRGDGTPIALTNMMEAKEKLLGTFTATPFRPTGLATADQALSNVVELLEGAIGLAHDCVSECTELMAAAPPERELLLASAAMLDDVARLLEGEDVRPDFDELNRLRAESSEHLSRLDVGRYDYVIAVKLAFHAEAIALAARSAGADALIAARRADPETIDARRYLWYGGSRDGNSQPGRLAGTRGVATAIARQASLRSVWFLNSVRAAVAITAAVVIADVTNVQHGFWVVLGTLSVLRTNAASTGSTALRALIGTTVGIVIGSVLISLIGTSETALWVTLPIAVLIASYAPGAAPFEVGQAAFTVLISVLFNLIVPVGTKIEVVRIEDVAIGLGVSLLVGILFWPRGAAGVVGDDIADAFRRGSDYLQAAVDWALRGTQIPQGLGVAASVAGIRIDDALRTFLAEQGAKRVSKQELWRLVGATQRLRLAAHSMTRLMVPDAERVPARDELSKGASELIAWYGRVAEHVGRPARNRELELLGPPPMIDVDGLDRAADHRCVAILWVNEHLRHLSEHAPEVVEPANHVAEQRRASWWH